MQSSPDGKAAVHVTSLAPDCGDSSNDVIGMAGCLRTLARKYAPRAKIGFHVSQWGGTASAIVSFFKAIGADQGDFLATDMLDRDAGCDEAHTDPNCQRTDGPWYFDETNTTSPNYTEHLAWVTQMTQGIGLPDDVVAGAVRRAQHDPGRDVGEVSRQPRSLHVFPYPRFHRCRRGGLRLGHRSGQSNVHHDRRRSVQERGQRVLRKPDGPLASFSQGGR